MECRNELNAIIRENHKYSTNYGNGLANHLPMVAIAMYKAMGENPETAEAMRSLNARYIENLELYVPRKALLNFHQITQERRLQFLGYDQYYSSWHAFFKKEIKSNGSEKVLENWLPEFVKGLSAGGGHCLLRTYFCLSVKDILDQDVFEAEMTISLAYFATNYLPLGEFNSRQEQVPQNSTTELALSNNEVILGDEAKTALMNTRLIATKLHIMSWDPSFQALRTKHHVNLDFENILIRLASQSIKNPDFALLHNLTVGQCILELLDWYPYLHNTLIKEAYADFVLGVYFLRRNDFAIESEAEINKSITVDDIRSEIPSRRNAHSIKSAFSLLELNNRFENQVFLASANAFMERYN